ncbi:hypothetical protein [Candidatus Poriferisodalis sp.]|uniref:hypothetical protein n=1 Tax=Candidatus Poriferisodalis sp. TaxID=3101277 RepID=UPI003B01265D
MSWHWTSARQKPLRSRSRNRGMAAQAAQRCERDERGDYSMFIAIVAAALLLFGGIAYDAPRLITARQHAVHNANEAARVAAATVAAGGTLEQARAAADDRMVTAGPLYGAFTEVAALDCVGTRVEVTVLTSYTNRSVIGVFRREQLIGATGAAEAELVGPGGQPALGYLPECPLRA